MKRILLATVVALALVPVVALWLTAGSSDPEWTS